ncbi:hypothetical protein STAS_20495, partial [Striga asiatica]
MSKTRLSMKLLMDTQAKRVLFAEAGKDCVDLLFHILSIPVARLVSLLGKQGMAGSLANLYESLENLNESYIQPNWTKDTLLKPDYCSPVPLLTTFKDSDQKKFFRCSFCTSHVTDCPAATCPGCHQKMGQALQYVGPPAGNEGGFVKGVVTYMVMDDLVVMPMSAISSITLLNKLNIKEVGALEEKEVNLGFFEAVKLVKASFETKSVLTHVFLNDMGHPGNEVEGMVFDKINWFETTNSSNLFKMNVDPKNPASLFETTDGCNLFEMNADPMVPAFHFGASISTSSTDATRETVPKLSKPKRQQYSVCFGNEKSKGGVEPSSKLTLKLLVDTQGKRVFFAEAGKDFADFLFRILSMPVGAIVGKQGNNKAAGSVLNLYQSVENLNPSYMQPNTTKVALLKPSLEATCPKCGLEMKYDVIYVNSPPSEGFVKGLVMYMVTDDLVVAPFSTISTIVWLNKFNIKDVGILEERVVNFGMDEAVKLLNACLHSNKVLTDVFLNEIKSANNHEPNMSETSSASSVTLKLLIDTKGKRVLFAEAGKDFIDFLFSLISLPVGTLLSLLKHHQTAGSLSSLYQSIQNLNESYIQPNQSKEALLKPVSGFFPLLALENGPSPAGGGRKFYRCTCNSTYVAEDPLAPCPHCGRKMATGVSYVAGPARKEGPGEGGFVKGVVTYMVMDDLVVMPMSTISSITLLNKFHVKEEYLNICKH